MEKNIINTIMPGKRMLEMLFKNVGDVVEFQILKGGNWYVGIITRVTPDGRYLYKIRFVHGRSDHTYYNLTKEDVKNGRLR